MCFTWHISDCNGSDSLPHGGLDEYRGPVAGGNGLVQQGVVAEEVKAGVVQGAGKATDGQAISICRDTSDVVAKLVKQNDTSDTTLPVKLHALLNDAHDHSFNRMVRWNDSGRSFAITDEKVFGEILCEKWLGISSLADFQAELESYGFKRRQNGM